MSDAHSPVPAVPATLGRYELLAPVARGGMGQVWAGRLRGARGFNKLVAVKTLLPLPGSEGRLESMLLEEARIAALIHHPNVVQTLELGEHDNTLYLVMEWVDGEPLSFILNRAEERRGMPLAIAVNLVAQTLLGLHAAHELTDETGTPLGVVHRDVSPHNVLVTYSGVAKLVDFGIAKATNQHSSVTEAGEVKGKFSYMAPEQVRCESVDRRADLFAVGIMLYTLTTGRHPFKSQHPAGVLHKITSDKPAPRPSQSVPSYSPALEAVLMKALEKSPAERWASAEEMLTALQSAVPEAFVPSIEAQVKDFMTELLSDRAAARREALRRAQLAADSRTGGSGSHLALNPGGPSQSASSLRALSIDQQPAEAEPESSGARASGRLTLPAPARRPRFAVLFGAAAGALLVAGLFLTRTVSVPRLLPGLAAPASGMVELPTTKPATIRNPDVSPTKSAAAPSEAASQQHAVANGAAGANSTGPAAPPSSTSVPARGQKAVGVNGRRAPRMKDLIAPDYAR